MTRPTRNRRTRSGAAGRSYAELVGEFGGRLPAAPPPRQRPPGRRAEYELLQPRTPRRGRRRPGHGWTPVPAPLVSYRASTAEVGGIWPLTATSGLPSSGALVGYDILSGAGFYGDPIGWVLAQPQITSNPNLAVFGAPGRGKSGMVKAFISRWIGFGAHALIPGDVKDEYTPLCRALGVEPIALGPGSLARINPLDLGPLGYGWDQATSAEQQQRAQTAFARWVVLLRALIGARGVAVSSSDEMALTYVLAELTGAASGNSRLAPVTIPQVWRALRDPSAPLVRECRYASAQAMIDDTRHAVDALGALVTGALAHLFDAETTITLDWAAPVQSLSLRRLERLGDEALALALTCLNSWTRGQTDLRRAGQIQIVVRDEVWRQMRLGLGAVQSLDADLRLSRNDGKVEVIIAHKPSDMLSVGDAGSQEVAIARDLMALCGTKALFGQDPNIATELAELLDLPPLVRDWVTGWCMQAPGRAVWIVGGRLFKVQTIWTRIDAALFDTNDALRPAASAVSFCPWPAPGTDVESRKKEGS